MLKRYAVTAILCNALIFVPAAAAQSPAKAMPSDTRIDTPDIDYPSGSLSRISRPYRAPVIPPISLANSGRLESLLRAGTLYLSMQDTIALALENNLDILLQRYGPLIADSDVLRAEAGGLLRGVPTSVQPGPSSATGQSGPTGQATGITQSAAAQAAQSGSAGVGTVITSTGTAVPSFDPSISAALQVAHSSSPQTSSTFLGTNSSVLQQETANVTWSQGFSTGTSVSLGMQNYFSSQNNILANINPYTTSSLGITITQNLLQGFGPAVNNRYIHIAKNNREVADLVFKAQVITTVGAVMNLYWDLVSFNDDVRAKEQALAQSTKLYNDNKKQVEIGTLAPIAIVQAEAQMATDQQNLTISQTRVLQQETLIKNALSRTGVASPSLAEAHIMPTDRIQIPAQEPVQPLQDLVATALSARPEMAENRIQLENSRISLKGSRSELLPSLGAFASLTNNALAGSVNTLPVPPGYVGIPVVRTPDNFFVGGFGTVLSQLFSRNFPNYAAGLQLNIPIRNRSAQADVIHDELSIRQQQISVQSAENQVRVDVQNAVIGLKQARATYDAATKARILQEQTLDAEQKKYALGASTIYNVILIQRDLAAAQSNEVSALSNYAKARVEIDRATGVLLTNNNISIEEAYRGKVSRPPSPLPVLQP